jgi:cullin 3
MQATQIPRDDLKPSLIGLSMVKGKMLLKKTPASKEIADTDIFSFNEKFDSKLMKIKFAAAGAQKEVCKLVENSVVQCEERNCP